MNKSRVRQFSVRYSNFIFLLFAVLAVAIVWKALDDPTFRAMVEENSPKYEYVDGHLVEVINGHKFVRARNGVLTRID